ncbi:MAG: hypothetical protein WAX89_03130, partial [Alphaproteobacteria bacterium]
MKNIALSFFVALLVCVIAVPLLLGSAGQVTGRESLYERVQKKGVLRCEYGMESPMLGKDPNTGEFYGIVYDIVERVG